MTTPAAELVVFTDLETGLEWLQSDLMVPAVVQFDPCLVPFRDLDQVVEVAAADEEGRPIMLTCSTQSGTMTGFSCREWAERLWLRGIRPRPEASTVAQWNQLLDGAPSGAALGSVTWAWRATRAEC